MKIVKDIKNSVPLIRIYDENYDYTYGYYTQNEWVDNTRLVLTRSPINPDRSRAKPEEYVRSKDVTELVLIDLDSETETVVCSADEFGRLASDYIVYKDMVYYTASDNCVYGKNVFTGEKKLYYKQETGRISHPHITNDGKYLNLTVDPENFETGMFSCLVINLETGETETVFETRFENPFPVADHMMICPTDKDKVFFAHEGTTFYIPNRLWLWERGNELCSIAKQELCENGMLADCFGHECWAADGKGLYFVKYPCSYKAPTGLCYVSVDGEQSDVLYSGHPYWHVCTSSNGRFLAADATSYDREEPPYSGVYIIDTKTNTEKLVVNAEVTFRHPSHPHPKFNLNTTKLSYHELFKGNNCVNIVNISDVIEGYEG